jgi:enoyl-CoA hydratase
LIVERFDAVLLVRLNRPEALNALNKAAMDDLTACARAFDADPRLAVMVLTGSEKAFAAGADVKEMASMGFSDAYGTLFEQDVISRCAKPTIAAVSGYALGGGCELALMADMIIAADTAKFGLPEIKLGVIPGIGGTQRLTRAIGKAKAMDLCLTGRMMDAAEAERSGLVARVVPAASLIEEALSIARTISGYSKVALRAMKEAVNVSQETSLSEGVRFERRLFAGLFATEDKKEGMAAFVEKRPPVFRDR